MASPVVRRSVWMEDGCTHMAVSEEQFTIGYPDTQHNGVSGILRVASQLREATEGKMDCKLHPQGRH